MPKLIIAIDGVIVKEAPLTKDRTTLGRRPYNDVVIDHLAVSGEHAMILKENGEAILQDRGSTNGTYLNGRFIQRDPLEHGDIIEIGRCRIQFIDGDERTVVPISAPGAGKAHSGTPATATAAARPPSRIKVLSGPSNGRELPLTKTVTTIGKAGVSVASITRRPYGFELAHVEGPDVPAVNGVAVDIGPIFLKNRDQLTVGGIRLEFLDR